MEVPKHKKYKKSSKSDLINYNVRMNKLDKINKDHFPKGFETKILFKDPYIVKLRRFLNTEEIDELISMAKGKFERSTIIVSDEMVKSDTRTSKTAFITDNGHYKKYSKPVERILKKVCYLTGAKRNQIESLMVVKYAQNDQFMEHHDYFNPKHTEMIADGGQRMMTFFVYLNSLDEEDGGETEFPLIDLKIKPSKGTAVFWWNQKSDGSLIKKTLHRGNPVLTNKIKYGLNLWVRSDGW